MGIPDRKVRDLLFWRVRLWWLGEAVSLASSFDRLSPSTSSGRGLRGGGAVASLRHPGARSVPRLARDEARDPGAGEILKFAPAAGSRIGAALPLVRMTTVRESGGAEGSSSGSARGLEGRMVESQERF